MVKNGSDLLGKERVLADGLATNAECTSLKNMVMVGHHFQISCCLFH